MAILRLTAVKAETGYRSSASIYNLIRAGLWTKPVAIGERSVGWPDDECKAINAARIAGRSEDEIRELVKLLHARRGEDFKRLMGTENAGGDSDEKPEPTGKRRVVALRKELAQ